MLKHASFRKFKKLLYFSLKPNIYAQDLNDAKKAIGLIKVGMAVLTRGGTTILEFAKQLPKNISATFFKINQLVAVKFAEYNNIEVILIGGLFSKKLPDYLW